MDMPIAFKVRILHTACPVIMVLPLIADVTDHDVQRETRLIYGTVRLSRYIC
jgi:hypothetical protein